MMGKEQQRVLTCCKYTGVIKTDFSQNIINLRKRLLLNKPFISDNIRADWEYPYFPVNLLYALFSRPFSDNARQASVHNYNNTHLAVSLKTCNNIDLRKFYEYALRYNNINKTVSTQNTDNLTIPISAPNKDTRDDSDNVVTNTYHALLYSNINKTMDPASAQNINNSMISILYSKGTQNNLTDLTRNNQYHNLIYSITKKSGNSVNVEYNISKTLSASAYSLVPHTLHFNENKNTLSRLTRLITNINKYYQLAGEDINAVDSQLLEHKHNNRNLEKTVLQNANNQQKQLLIYDIPSNHKNRDNQNLTYSEIPLLHHNNRSISSISDKENMQNNNEPVNEKIIAKFRGDIENMPDKPMNKPINLPSIDINNLVNEIYGRLESKLRIERERRGIFR